MIFVEGEVWQNSENWKLKNIFTSGVTTSSIGVKWMVLLDSDHQIGLDPILKDSSNYRVKVHFEGEKQD